MPSRNYNTRAVHCPHCGATPGHPCKAPGGDRRRVDHSERGRLAYALAHPMDALQGDRVAAEKYRLKHPGVQVGRVICAPSRAQALWYGLPYNQAVYELEHGTDTSMEVLPVADAEDAEYVGQPVSEILDQMTVKVPRNKKKD